MHGLGKRFVYILSSASDRRRHYVGVTGDPERRFGWHDFGPCGHAADHRPRSAVGVIEFQTEQQAVRFEKYLKSRSGRVFARRHFAGDTDRGRR
jgi:putative endonuclease